MKPTVSERPHGGVERGEEHVLGQYVRLGEPVEEGGLAGVGVAHERDGRERDATAGLPRQGAGAPHLLQLALQPRHPLGDQAPVSLDLGLARPAHGPEAAALALQVGPGAHEPRSLVGEPRQLHLQPPFPRPRAVGEDLEDEAGAVDHLDVPGPFEVALLHGRERVIDHHDVQVLARGDLTDLGHLAPAKQRRRPRRAQLGARGPGHLQVERLGQPDRLGEARGGVPRRIPPRPCRMDDEGGLDGRASIDTGCGQSAESGDGS
jgi:hypothetical protein